MNIDLLLTNFDRLIDSPEAIPKLRELILDLAVRGKLISQDPAESGSISDMERQRIEVHDAASELPYEIPGNWIWTSLHKLGDTKPRNNADDSQMVSFVSMSMISVDYRQPVTHEVKRWSDIKKGYTHFAEGDVGLAKITPCFENGKSCVFKGLTNGMGAGTTELHVFRSTGDHVIPEYILLFLKSPGFIQRGIPRMTGTAGQKRVPTDYFANSPLPLPPLAEQRRIVARVDELMAQCDRLEAQLRQRDAHQADLARAAIARFTADPTPANLEYLFHDCFDISPADLRKVILSLAVQGKLVKQDPSEGNAENLIKLNHANASANPKRQRKSDQTFLDHTGLHSIPKHWNWVRLEDILADGPTNGYSPKTVDYKTKVKTLSLSATTTGTFRGEYVKYVVEEIPEDSSLWLEDGDILVQRGNTIEYVGVPAIYRGKAKEFIYPDLMMRVRITRNVDVDYTHMVMSEASSRDFLRDRATGTSGSMPKINQGALKSLPIPLPPYKEQLRIMQIVSSMLKMLDTLEHKIVLSKGLIRECLSN